MTQFLLLSQQGTSPQRSEKETEPPTNLEDFNVTMDTSLPDSYAVDQPGPGFPNISITRNEILALSNVLGRIPPSFLEGSDLQTGPEFSVSGIENPPITPHQSTTETDLPGANYSYEGQLDNDLNEVPAVRNKRQRPRDSLKGSMLRKHLVLKFSATGPIDREKTPHKWWCRVCKLELSSMSRGVLEVLAHYKTDSHLVREHRIRMDTTGMPLYDKNGHELQPFQKLRRSPKKPTLLSHNWTLIGCW